MQGPVDGDVKRSSRISPSIAATLPRHLYSVASMRRSDWFPPIACIGAVDRPRLVDVMTSALLWAATVVGSVALVLNAVTGDGSGGLWVTTSAAALAVVARRRGTTG